jgi:hypothetical protein
MEVKSYIKIPSKMLPDDFLLHPEDFFILIDDSERLQGVINEIDSDYIEGAITLKYYDTFILDFELWDLVGVFWAYLINMLEEVLKEGSGHCYLPDQPIRVEMVKLNNHSILLSIGKGEFGTFTLPFKEFSMALLDGAEHFFQKISKDLSINKFDFHMQQIINLRAEMNDCF